MLRVSAYSSRSLLSVLRGLRNLDRETRKQTRQHLRPMVQQAWQAELAKRASTRLEQRVLVDTARTRVSDQNVRLTSASLSRSLSGGLKPSLSYAPVEFGALPSKTTYQRTRKGNAHQVTRNTTAQFKKPRRQGYVVYPTVANIVPRVLAMYVQTFARAIHEALEGKAQ